MAVHFCRNFRFEFEIHCVDFISSKSGIDHVTKVSNTKTYCAIAIALNTEQCIDNHFQDICASNFGKRKKKPQNTNYIFQIRDKIKINIGFGT